jgi:hypothetical protein
MVGFPADQMPPEGVALLFVASMYSRTIKVDVTNS